MAAILLVDDDDGNRVTLAALLEDEHYAVTEAPSYGEAQAAIERGGFDLVLLDYHLGNRLGTDLLPLIRQHMPKAKVILLSGSVSIGRVTTDDLDGTIVKSVAFPEALAAIKRVIGS